MPISKNMKNMNTKNKNAKQCAANSYTPQGLGQIAIIQSEDVFTKEILQRYTDISRKQVKTSNNPRHIFRFIVKQIKEYGTRTFIIHLNDEDLLSFVNYLEDKLTNFKKYRTLVKGVKLLATLSTSDDVRQRVSSTTYVKELMQFYQSPLSVVLSTFEPGVPLPALSEEPVKKTILVIVSDKENQYYDQVDEYFNDNDSTKVKKVRVSELPNMLTPFSEAVLLIDNEDEMKKCAKFLNDNNFYGTINLVNATKNMLNESEFQNLLAKKGVKGKSLYSGVKYNVEENKYSEFSRPCDKQVLEMISAGWGGDLVNGLVLL